MKTETLLVHRPGHHLTVHSVGWGEPQTIYTRCTCGWKGVVLRERWFRPDERAFTSLSEPFGDLVRTYGIEILLEDNNAYGTIRDAIRQALAHVGYDPEADHEQSLADLTAATEGLQHTLTGSAQDTEAICEAGRPVKAALTALGIAAARRTVWEEAPVPVPATRDPQGVRLVAEAYAAAHHRSDR